ETEKESVSESIEAEVEKDTITKVVDVEQTESVSTAIVSEQGEVLSKDEVDTKHSDKLKIGIVAGVAGVVAGGIAAVIADSHKKEDDTVTIVADTKETESVTAIVETKEGEIISEDKIDTKETDKVTVGIETAVIDKSTEAIAENDTVIKVVETVNDSVNVIVENQEGEVISKDEIDTKDSHKVTVGVVSGVGAGLIGVAVDSVEKSTELAAVEKEKVSIIDTEKTDVVSAVIVSGEGEIISKEEIDTSEVSVVKVDIKPLTDVKYDVIEDVEETVNVQVVVNKEEVATSVTNINDIVSKWLWSLSDKLSLKLKSKDECSNTEIDAYVDEEIAYINKYVLSLKGSVLNNISIGWKNSGSVKKVAEFDQVIDWALSLATQQATTIKEVVEHASSNQTDLSATLNAYVESTTKTIEVGLNNAVVALPECPKVVVDMPVVKSTETVAINQALVLKSTYLDWFQTFCGGIKSRFAGSATISEEEVAIYIDSSKAELDEMTIKMKNTLTETCTDDNRKTIDELIAYFDNSKKVVESKLVVVKDALAVDCRDSEKKTAAIDEIIAKVDREVTTEVTEIEQSAVHHLVKSDLAIETAIQQSSGSKIAVIEESHSVVEKDTALERVNQASGNVSSWFAGVIARVKSMLEVGDCSEDVEAYIAEEEAKLDKTDVSSWFTIVVGKITSMLEVGDCSEDVEAYIVEEQSKLDIILKDSKSDSSVDGTVSTVFDKQTDVFYEKVKESVKTQLEVVKASVKETSTDSAAKAASLAAIAIALESTISDEVQETKDVVEHTAVIVDQKKKVTEELIRTQVESEAVVVYESREHAKEETYKVVEESVLATKANLYSWFDLFFGRIKHVVAGSTKPSKAEIDFIIANANKEIAKVIKDARSSSVARIRLSGSKADTKTTTLISNVEKEVSTAYDRIYTLIIGQLDVITEVVLSEDTEHIQEKLESLEVQAKKRAGSALESVVQNTTVTVFEGKTSTWIETSEVPKSFKNVKVYAFDLADIVVDYRRTIRRVWADIYAKHECALSEVAIEELAVRWYTLYLEERMKAKHSVVDIDVLRVSLKLVLAEFKIQSVLDESEIEVLCAAWLKLELFEDTSSSIHKIEHIEGVYVVAISHGFTIRTMMEQARNYCLCWQAQFTADIFAACTVRDGTSNAVTVLSNTAMLLGLENPSELAVVSANTELLQAAKQNGSQTVSIGRFGQTFEATTESDLHFDGLDIFAESIETFYEAEAASHKTESAPAPRSWFQRVVDTVIG
ncbi:hypothetical protein K501DRAFT_308011, partial [Backusella circina FSU 941]